MELGRRRKGGAALIFISKHIEGSYGVFHTLYTNVLIGMPTRTGLVAPAGVK